MKATIAVIGAALFASSLAMAGNKLPNLVSACKKECPDAKDNAAAHECAEALEHGTDEAVVRKFKKSHCYKAHEAWEEKHKTKEEAKEGAEEKHE